MNMDAYLAETWQGSLDYLGMLVGSIYHHPYFWPVVIGVIVIVPIIIATCQENSPVLRKDRVR